MDLKVYLPKVPNILGIAWHSMGRVIILYSVVEDSISQMYEILSRGSQSLVSNFIFVLEDTKFCSLDFIRKIDCGRARVVYDENKLRIKTGATMTA